MSPLGARWMLALLSCSGLLFYTSPARAIPDDQIRKLVQLAQNYERQPTPDWEKIREIYEDLLGQKDPGLRIRERYHHAQRRCWQQRRHQDPSYCKEVLSIEYGQALRLYKTISITLLEGGLDKKKLDPTKLFRKGMEEFDSALADPRFLKEYVPAGKHADVAAFRTLLKKTWGNMGKLSREEAVKQIGEVAMAAEFHLNLNATVVTMEFACGACYAIDEYTVYLTPNQLRQLAQSLSRSEAIGVGLTLTVRDNNRIVIYAIMMDSPAAQEGISEGDQIISVNKKAVADLPLHTVKEMLEGPVGSTVDIELLAPGDTNVRALRLQRQRALVADIEATMVEEPYTSIGYIKVRSFTDTTVQDLDGALTRMTQEFGMKALILDLRDNGGGIFESAIDSARRFLVSGIIASTLNHDSKANFVYQAKNPNALRIPMAVLVNGDTASAAEVLAGALKDNNRAYLIGQTTFGKGCTQCVLKLPDATGGLPTGGMKLTVSRFFSPKGVPYSGRGIVPHFLVDDGMPASQSMLGDAYRAKAIEELTRVLAMQK
jgi:carboxyl-terminal processing protease